MDRSSAEGTERSGVRERGAGGGVWEGGRPLPDNFFII